MIAEIREKVRARHPRGEVAPGGVELADLLPLVHARDAAEGKVASIGTVNPRPGGPVNSFIQWVKRMVARALDWHVREQVEFNRAVMGCVQSTIEALNDTNRALAAVSARMEALGGEARERARGLEDEARELKDIRAHWVQWRQEWERKLAGNEIQFLRSLSDLQGAWQHRVTLQDESHRERMKALHADFQGALDRSGEGIQKRLWADLDRIRVEYEGIIHNELRLLRQKASLKEEARAVLAPGAAGPDGLAAVDWLKFGEKFRGSEEYVKRHLHLYTERFAGAVGEVVDLGCGRGELLEALRAAGIGARGIDLNTDCVVMCGVKGFKVERVDLFQFLDNAADNSLGGIAALQVIEHLPPDRVPGFIATCHAKLKPGAMIALETPNPECLAIFARHFYLDPTHFKPLPPALTAFYLEEAGFGRLETIRLEPAVESMPSLAALPAEFRGEFFGALDYAIFGRKL